MNYRLEEMGESVSKLLEENPGSNFHITDDQNATPNTRND